MGLIKVIISGRENYLSYSGDISAITGLSCKTKMEKKSIKNFRDLIFIWIIMNKIYVD